jgi:DNA replication and repair protein RecF
MEVEIIEQITNIKPIVLLDDVFSELDASRRQAITKYLRNYQTIITTTDADVVIKGFKKNTNLIKLG